MRKLFLATLLLAANSAFALSVCTSLDQTVMYYVSGTTIEVRGWSGGHAQTPRFVNLWPGTSVTADGAWEITPTALINRADNKPFATCGKGNGWSNETVFLPGDMY